PTKSLFVPARGLRCARSLFNSKVKASVVLITQRRFGGREQFERQSAQDQGQNTQCDIQHVSYLSIRNAITMFRAPKNQTPKPKLQIQSVACTPGACFLKFRSCCPFFAPLPMFRTTSSKLCNRRGQRAVCQSIARHQAYEA